MAGGGQRAVARQRFVDRALVDAAAVHLGGGVRVDRLEPHDRQLGVEFARPAVDQVALFVVLAAPFQLAALDLAAVGRLFSDVVQFELVVHDFKLEHYAVDRYFVFACKVLLRAGQERGREEEAGEPEALGRALVFPLLHELDPAFEVDQPVRQRLDGEEAAAGLLGPAGRHVVVHEFDADHFEFVGHHDAASVGFDEFSQIVVHFQNQGIVSLTFLSHDRVHGFVVVGRELTVQKF